MVAAVRKLISKGGRKRKARGVKPASPEQKMGAKQANMSLLTLKNFQMLNRKDLLKKLKMLTSQRKSLW